MKSAPAPRRDLSGVWDATGEGRTPRRAGIQATGANEHRAVLPGNNAPPGGEPDERNIPNPLPYTPLGEATLESHKPTGLGVRSVPAVLGNDPVDICDPPGFPRLELHEFRAIEIIQAVGPCDCLESILSDLAHHLDRRAGASHESRTQIDRLLGGQMGGRLHVCDVETVGMTDNTWLDNAGRPHSSELKVEEQFHRVDHDHHGTHGDHR